MTDRRCTMGVRLVAAWLALGAAGGWAADWPQWRGPDRTGTAGPTTDLIDRLPEEGLPPKWITSKPLNGGWGSPVVAKGRVFVFTHTSRKRPEVTLPPEAFPELPESERARRTAEELKDYDAARSKESVKRRRQEFEFSDNVHCVDARTGEIVWERSWPGAFVHWGQSSTPTLHDDALYVMGSDRQVHALAGQDGTPRWTTPLPIPETVEEPVSSSVAVSGNIGIVLAHRLTGLNLETGEVRWQSGDDVAGMHSSPTIGRDGDRTLAVVNVRGGKTVGVDLESGRERWRIDAQAERSSPVIFEDRLLTYGSDRKAGLRCYRLNGEVPKEEWVYQRAMDPGATPVVTRDAVLISGDKLIACVDLATGKQRWMERLDLAKCQYGSPIAVGDVGMYAQHGLWLFDMRNDDAPVLAEGRFGVAGLLATPDQHRQRLGMSELERTDPAKAEQTWQREVVNKGPVDCTSPAIVDGFLYIRLRTGLACYDLKRDEQEKAKPALTDARE